MGLKSLLLSRDPRVIQVLCPTLDKLSIGVEICSGTASGNKILSSEKFDGVIVDCDDLQGGLDLLERLRKGASNKNSVSFAILNGHTRTNRAFELGANFVLQKPISALNATRGFNAGLWLMTVERRRYFRHPVEMEVTVVFGQGQKLTATATNISQSGMAIRFHSGELQKGSISKVIFTLPGTHVLMETKTDLAWADGTGRAGLRFVKVPQCSLEQLQHWLGKQMEEVDRQTT
jgi:CheY-like chemotaxis protein